MPVWLTLLGYAYKAFIWWYGDTAHQKLVAHLAKYTPLKADPNPPLPESNNPNLSNPKDRGGWVK